MTEKCLNHLDYCGEICPDCGLPVDKYGNTEYQFDFCSFPDCGCDGARLCAVIWREKPARSQRKIRAKLRYVGRSKPLPFDDPYYAEKNNVEGMWRGKTQRQRKAVMALISDVYAGKKRD